MNSNTENLLVGLLALVLLPVIGWRIWRGLRQGALPLYKTRLDRAEAGAAKFNVLLGLHVLLFLLIAVVAADLLLGLGLKERLL
jgi:hypothetical protein